MGCCVKNRALEPHCLTRNDSPSLRLSPTPVKWGRCLCHGMPRDEALLSHAREALLSHAREVCTQGESTEFLLFTFRLSFVAK